jgi:hypothetical protein
LSEDESECKDNVASQEIFKLLEHLCKTCALDDKSLATPVEQTLDLLQDHIVLLEAQKMLSEKSQDKSLNIILRAQIYAMLGVINLFLDTDIPHT